MYPLPPSIIISIINDKKTFIKDHLLPKGCTRVQIRTNQKQKECENTGGPRKGSAQERIKLLSILINKSEESKLIFSKFTTTTTKKKVYYSYFIVHIFMRKIQVKNCKLDGEKGRCIVDEDKHQTSDRASSYPTWVSLAKVIKQEETWRAPPPLEGGRSRGEGKGGVGGGEKGKRDGFLSLSNRSFSVSFFFLSLLSLGVIWK